MVKTFLKLGIIMMLSGLSINVAAQSTFTGSVYDNTGESLPGAAIMLKGTSEGTVTDLDGSFALEVSKSGDLTLVFSYIGYDNKELNVSSSNGKTVDLGKVVLESGEHMLESVDIIASVAKDRETPVAISSIKPEMIAEKLGTQEFPEILKSTPSVYTTKEGGGFGDSRITMRGFDSNNIGILINGIPINDMESGKVYWSNWAGLSDVTRSMQVQRGLGASKLAVPSVGGTMNIITNSTNATKGGSAGAWMGNDGYLKQAFSLSTGLSENGWAFSISGSHTSGDGYIQGTSFEGWNYFANVSKIINDKQSISFTAFGAPQSHSQRRTQHTIQQYEENGVKWNSDMGYRNGEEYTNGYNFYHKPQMSINHFWQIDETSKLATSVYASIASGGGRSIDGDSDHWLEYDYSTGAPADGTMLTDDGYLDYDGAVAANAALAEQGQGGQVYAANSINNHQWYGLLTSYEKDIRNFNLTAGFDGRYYKGEHYKEIDDLMGADFIMDATNVNDVNLEDQVKREGDVVSFNSPGEVLYAGLFGQGEYVSDRWSAFASLSAAANEYRRTDYFNQTPGNEKTSWQNYNTWTTKGGANYNINSQHNVFGNIGYISRAPYFSNAFVGYSNTANTEAQNEKIFTTELGYGFQTNKINIKSNLYYTQWNDRGLVKSFGDNVANIPGINEIHYGFELEGEYRINHKLNLRAMFSIGNWYYADNVNFDLYDDNQQLIGSYDAYIKDVHVGDAAQTTAALGINYEILPKLKIGVDMNYAGRNYAYFDPTNRTSADDQVDAWEMPSAFTMDVNMKYDFKIGSLDATAYSNVHNLLNNEYIADATDGANHDQSTALVYYGFGTTWSAGLKVKF